MTQNSTLTMNFRCGEIFQKKNQEFIIVCVHCNKEFFSYSIFTSHLIQKICSANVTPLLQHTLKIEKDITGNVLIEPKIESSEKVKNDNRKGININTEFLKKRQPKIEPIEILDDDDGDNDVNNRISNKNILLNKIKKELITNSPKLIKRTRIVKKKIIWDPDDPHTQLLCENYQNQKSPIKKLNKEIIQQQEPPTVKPPKKQSSKKQLKKLLNKFGPTNNLVKTVQKQSRIGSVPRVADQSKRKKIKRIKKIIWDPDAPEEEINLYKTRSTSIKLPNAI